MTLPTPHLDATLDRLGRRFRFETVATDRGLTVEADELVLHIRSEADEFTVIFEPPDPLSTPIHIAVRASEIEAVLRELLAG